ncbi:MAG: hypothetical protein DMG93_19520 [Acidobacteria bacterium]|nr:MAG: hypothetical protein DMG93_19520 [Acidobacteriota bacterium]
MALVPSRAQGQAAGCLSYDSTRVTLHGILTRMSFPVPAKYENVRTRDKAETYWFLKLEFPRCVNQDKSEPDLNPAQTNIKRVQLVLDPEMYKRYRNLVGKSVTVSGTLFGAHTAHHHTCVLLSVITLQPIHSE